METLTQEYVKSIFSYKDGRLHWIKQKHGRRNTKGTAGCLNKSNTGQRYIVGINKISYLRSRIIFLWHNGWLPEVVDHIDRNKINDRIENLRAATKSDNQKNTTSRKNSISKYLGVSMCQGKYWRAQIKIADKNKHLGLFPTEEAAALAYNEAAKAHNGEFASLNHIVF